MKKRIRMGKHAYTVHYIKGGVLSANEGITEFGSNKITLDSTSVKSQLESTLAHEMLHVFLHQSGACEIIGTNEELLVRTLEDTFYTFLKENTNFYD